MSVIDGVFGNLRVMSLLQLLLAFVACTGYALAQGHLVKRSGRKYLWGLTALGAMGFALESNDWMSATMLFAFLIVGMGLFVLTVWLTSWVLGVVNARTESGGALAEPAPLALPAGAARNHLGATARQVHSV
jgi:hypothetical protein